MKLGTTQAQRKLFVSLSRARREVARIDDSDPLKELSPAEVARVAGRLNVRNDDVREMELRMRNRDVSIDVTVTDDSAGTRLDMMADPDADVQADVIRREDGGRLKVKIESALEKLPVKERYIVDNRLMADEPMTLGEIGKSFGVTRERVRQLETRAMKLMREQLGEFAPAP